MILSVSRRTDIPAFYADWFYERVKNGKVYVRNPINKKMISEIEINSKNIEFIVFWTKNPKPMVKNLYLLEGYKFYFQYTLNNYDKTIEKNLPKLDERLNTFQILSKKIGKEKIIWRYDPIIFTNKMNTNYHINSFKQIANSLKGFTNVCTISFLDFYSKTKRNSKDLDPISPDIKTMKNLVKSISEIAKENGIKINTCAEKTNFSDYGVQHGKCVDPDLISKITNREIDVKKDKYQRNICGCVESIDIGVYNSCLHDCVYCYANVNKNMCRKSNELHKKDSPLLIGFPFGNEKITKRRSKTIFKKKSSGQQTLFN